MVALADSMGVSIGQLRAMAAQGQLTTDVVVKGLLSQGGCNRQRICQHHRLNRQGIAGCR